MPRSLLRFLSALGPLLLLLGGGWLRAPGDLGAPVPFQESASPALPQPGAGASAAVRELRGPPSRLARRAAHDLTWGLPPVLVFPGASRLAWLLEPAPGRASLPLDPSSSPRSSRGPPLARLGNS